MAAVCLLVPSGFLAAQRPFQILDRIGSDSRLAGLQQVIEADHSPGEETDGDREHVPVIVFGDEPLVFDELPVSLEEIERILENARARLGDGGGADVGFQTLTAIQTNFVGDSACPVDCDGMTPDVQPCNVVLLFWEEEQFNPEGVDVLIDGTAQGNVPGLPLDQVPGTNVVFVGGVPTGSREFRVQDPNTFSFDDVTLTVVDDQPFGDVANVQCSLGPFQTADSTCPVIMGFANSGPLPDSNTALVTDSVNMRAPQFGVSNDPDGDGILDFSLQTLVNAGARPDDTYQFTLVGFLEDEESPQAGQNRALYRGCFIDGTGCEIACEQLACPAPFQLWVAQSRYGTEPTDTRMMAFWFLSLNEEFQFVPYPEGIHLFDLGTEITDPANPIPGDTTAVILPVPPGDHRLGVQGDCGADDSAITEKDFVTLEESPVTDPVDGDIVLTFDPAAGSTTATWTNNERSAFVGVYLVPDPDNLPADFPGEFPDDFIAGDLPGTESTYTFAGTRQTDHLAFQFFRYMGDQAFGSEPIIGRFEVEQEFFVRGLCSGVAGQGPPVPQLTDAVFLFRFLFLGGEDPPCQEACDTNSSGRVEITDGIVVLNFLFIGGPPPDNWVGTDPTCEPVMPGTQLPCATPLERCDGPGPILP